MKIFDLKDRKREIAIIYSMIGIIVITYGLTRWFVTSMLVEHQVGILYKYHVPETPNGMRVLKEVVTSGGIYQWMSGAIFCCAGGSVLLFVAYYAFKLNTPTITRREGLKT